MITALTRDAINQATDALVAVLQPEQVILFGSHAWGQPDGDSDLDIMIILSQSHLTPIQRVWQAREALKQFAFPKDILVVTRDEFDARQRDQRQLDHEIRSMIQQCMVDVATVRGAPYEGPK